MGRAENGHEYFPVNSGFFAGGRNSTFLFSKKPPSHT